MINMFESLREGLGELWQELEHTEFIPAPASTELPDVREHVAQVAVAFDTTYLERAYDSHNSDETETVVNVPASPEVKAYAEAQQTPVAAPRSEEDEEQARLVAQFEEQVKQSFTQS
jgi:hypothetical protein